MKGKMGKSEGRALEYKTGHFWIGYDQGKVDAYTLFCCIYTLSFATRTPHLPIPYHTSMLYLALWCQMLYIYPLSNEIGLDLLNLN